MDIGHDARKKNYYHREWLFAIGSGLLLSRLMSEWKSGSPSTVGTFPVTSAGYPSEISGNSRVPLSFIRQPDLSWQGWLYN